MSCEDSKRARHRQRWAHLQRFLCWHDRPLAEDTEDDRRRVAVVAALVRSTWQQRHLAAQAVGRQNRARTIGASGIMGHVGSCEVFSS